MNPTLTETMNLDGKIVLEGDETLLSLKPEKLENVLNAPAFAGSVFRDAKSSVAGTMALAGLYMSDVYHLYDVDDAVEHYNLVMRHSGNTTLADGETTMAEIFDDAYERLCEAYYGVGSYFGDANPDKAAERAGETIEHMAAESWFYAGKMESQVKRAIERDFDTEVLSISRRYKDEQPTPISEVTPFENPEARGIDLYLPEEGVGIQVKSGNGGHWSKDRDEVHADLLARVHWEDEITPQIEITPIRD